MKRYLVLTELFLPTKGGTAVWFDEVYRRIGDEKTHVITASAPGDSSHDREHPNTVHRLDLKRIPWLKPESLGMYVKLFGLALWLAATRRFNAIHAGRALPEGLVALAIGRLTVHPVVTYAHGEELTTWGRGAKFRAMRTALRYSDTVIANSDYTRAQLIEMGVTEHRIRLVNPGVDIVRFRPGLPCQDLRERLGLNESKKLILSVGRLSRRKGFDTVVRALATINSDGAEVHYALIGIGEDEVYLRSLAAECRVARNVHFLGHVESDELPRWYNACDLFVMPNREINGDTEGFGMVFIEAAACGKPAVAGIAGGTGAAVVHGKTGLRVDGESAEMVAKAIRRLLDNRGERERMGQAGYRRVAADFAWELVSERVNAL